MNMTSFNDMLHAIQGGTSVTADVDLFYSPDGRYTLTELFEVVSINQLCDLMDRVLAAPSPQYRAELKGDV